MMVMMRMMMVLDSSCSVDLHLCPLLPLRSAVASPIPTLEDGKGMRMRWSQCAFSNRTEKLRGDSALLTTRCPAPIALRIRAPIVQHRPTDPTQRADDGEGGRFGTTNRVWRHRAGRAGPGEPRTPSAALSGADTAAKPPGDEGRAEQERSAAVCCWRRIALPALLGSHSGEVMEQ